MHTESQNKQILEYLRRGKLLTPLQALDLFGCLRLSARIMNLRDQGHEIKTEIITLENGKRVAQYSL